MTIDLNKRQLNLILAILGRDLGYCGLDTKAGQEVSQLISDLLDQMTKGPVQPDLEF